MVIRLYRVPNLCYLEEYVKQKGNEVNRWFSSLKYDFISLWKRIHLAFKVIARICILLAYWKNKMGLCPSYSTCVSDKVWTLF